MARQRPKRLFDRLKAGLEEGISHARDELPLKTSTLQSDQSTRILGIDPGLRITGYGVIEASKTGPKVIEAGIIQPGEDGATDLAVRVAKLYDGMVEVIEAYRPAAVAVEQLYAHYDHPRTAILMGHARGVILLAAAKHDIPVTSYASTLVKKTITGHGRASKDQMQNTIQRELRLSAKPEPADVADALAVALCHYFLHHKRTLGSS